MRKANPWPAAAAAGLIVALLGQDPVAAQQRMSPVTHNKLQEANELLDQDQHDQALTKLKKLLTRAEGRPYSRAVILQTMGYAHLGADEREAAINAFERALELEALPREPAMTVEKQLARLYAAAERYTEARATLEGWFDEADSPSAEDYALLANIYAQLEAYERGVDAIQKALATTSQPDERLHQLAVSIYHRAERYERAAETLETMLRHWPATKRYWTRLAAIYVHLDRREQAHATLKLAYRRGLLETEEELVRLARLGINIGVPDHAARLLESEIADGRVADNAEHWALCARAWLNAKEWNRAIRAYGEAASGVRHGRFHLRQAHAAMRNNDWDHVVGAAQKALQRGGLDSPGRAHMLLGMAHFNREDYRQGLAAFEEAAEHEDVASRARQWASYVETKLQNGSELSGIDPEAGGSGASSDSGAGRG